MTSNIVISSKSSIGDQRNRVSKVRAGAALKAMDPPIVIKVGL